MAKMPLLLVSEEVVTVGDTVAIAAIVDIATTAATTTTRTVHRATRTTATRLPTATLQSAIAAIHQLTTAHRLTTPPATRLATQATGVAGKLDTSSLPSQARQF